MTATASDRTAGVVAAADEVGRRDVALRVGDRPQPWHEDEDQGIDDDRVGHREEAADRAGCVHRRRHRHERVRRVEVATEQEPGDDRAEAPTTEAPLVERVHVVGFAPPRGVETAGGDDDEEEDQDAECDAVDVAREERLVRCGRHGAGRGQAGAHRSSPPLAASMTRKAAYVKPEARKTHSELVPVEEGEAPQVGGPRWRRSGRSTRARMGMASRTAAVRRRAGGQSVRRSSDISILLGWQGTEQCAHDSRAIRQLSPHPELTHATRANRRRVGG